ncbi:MAG: 50S ribosomal protein L19 [Myxococcota bacterium]
MGNRVPQIEAIERAQMRERPAFRVGDTIKVHYRIREGEKERIQIFQGVVIRRNNGGIGATFTVRKISYGVGVERIFPFHSPRVERVEVESRAHVRRARLYYLRDLSGKKARLRASKKKSADISGLNVDLSAKTGEKRRKRGKKRKKAALAAS